MLIFWSGSQLDHGPWNETLERLEGSLLGLHRRSRTLGGVSTAVGTVLVYPD